MDINDLRVGVTVLTMLMFAGIVWWAYSDRRKTAYDEAAMLPFDDDLPPSVATGLSAGLPNKPQVERENERKFS